MIFYLYRQEDAKQPPLIQRQKSKFFSTELLFLETMVLDHLHMYYKDALAKVKLVIDEPKVKLAIEEPKAKLSIDEPKVKLAIDEPKAE